MADKMMRIAGRNNSGLSKGLKTNNDGNLEIVSNTTIPLVSSSTTINNDAPFVSEYFSGDGYQSATLVLNFSSNKNINILVRRIRKQGDNFITTSNFEVIYKSTEASDFHVVDFDINSSHFQYKIELSEVTTAGTIRPESYILKSTNKIQRKSVSNLKEGTVTLANNSTVDVRFNTVGYSNFILTMYADSGVDLSSGNKVRIQYIDYYLKGSVFPLRVLGELLDSQQPQIALNSSGSSSSGVTTKIPILSEISTSVRLVNLTGKSVTFRYLISGFVN
ncbi:hypothetical protein [Aerococcus urinaeequi]|uniref:hypothetical protein n=1 Tax=Aerococcus urinaeequi TaxID=51665 RepID=UPI003D6BE117